MYTKQSGWAVEAFGPCLKRILESRKISASELARMMAYKSRNSIFRILDEAGGHGARQAFFDRLTQEDPLALDAQERAALERALEVSRVGRHAFLSNCAMHEMLMNTRMGTREPQIRIDNMEDKADPAYLNALAEMTHGRRVYITITGCCDREIFEALRAWIGKADETCEVRVTHLVYTGEEEIVRNISAIQPMLYCDFYTAYCVEPGVFSKERESLYRQNYIHVQAQNAQGQWYRQTLALVEKGVFIPLGKMPSGEGDRFKRYFEEDLRRMPLLKTEIPGSGRVESYLSYTENCWKLEANRAVYTIKPDIALSCIHPDILLPCVKEEFWQRAGEKAEELKAAFCRIHLARWENFYGKRWVNHMIFSQEAMKQFARTGRQSDHFFAIRAYTPQERVQILTRIKQQAQENPNFCIDFFKEEFKPPMTEIGLYEGEGTLMTKPQTNYDLAGDHAEAVITQKEFCERYKEFYVKDLLVRHVIAKEETMALMEKLIAIAKEAS